MLAYLTPVVISLAASLTTSSVRRFKKPSSSSFPYKPQAEYGGSPLFRGKSENFGSAAGVAGIIPRIGFPFPLYSGCDE